MGDLEEKVNGLIASFTEWQVMVSGQLKELESRTSEASIRKAVRAEHAQEAEYLDTLRRDVVKLLKEMKESR